MVIPVMMETKPGWLLLVVISITALLPSQSRCECVPGTPCNTPDGRSGFCNSTGQCTVYEPLLEDDLRFNIVVKYPEDTLVARGGRDLYIRGNTLGFKWEKGVMMVKTDQDTWQTTVTYSYGIDGTRCRTCESSSPYAGKFLDYRIFVDDKTDMIGGNLQLTIPLSKTSTFFTKPLEFYAYPWFFTRNSSSVEFNISAPQIGRSRSIVLHKPPSFSENPYKTYPTVIAFDVNYNFYRSISHLLTDPIVENGRVGEFILIGFGDYDVLNERANLLTPTSGEWYTCINGTYENNCGGCLSGNLNASALLYEMHDRCGTLITEGGKGNNTLDFLVDTVLPKVQQLTNNRSRVEQKDLAVVGFSLGGLMACHAGWTRPDVFGYAACQSPSLWWPIANYIQASFFFVNVSLVDEELNKNRPPQKIFLDVGGLEVDNTFTMVQAMLHTADYMTSTQFFRWEENLWANVVPGATHSYQSWFERLWQPLRAFFPTNPKPKMSACAQALVSSASLTMTSLTLIKMAALYMISMSLLSLFKW